jgi:hypothetical protein
MGLGDDPEGGRCAICRRNKAGEERDEACLLSAVEEL